MHLRPKLSAVKWRPVSPQSEHWLYLNDTHIGRVVAFGSEGGKCLGWYWVVEYEGDEKVPKIPKDTSDQTFGNVWSAKAGCIEHLRKFLKELQDLELAWVRYLPDKNRAAALLPPSGATLLVNDQWVVGEVKPFRVSYGVYRGWYWVARNPEGFPQLGIEPKSSKAEPLDDFLKVKLACWYYVVNQLLGKYSKRNGK